MTDPEFEVKPITPTDMRILSGCTIKNASLGESIDAVADCREEVRLLYSGIQQDVRENETRKNPEQAFKRHFSEGSYPCIGSTYPIVEGRRNLLSVNRGGDHSAPSHLLSFSTSHASTSTHDENGPAFCFFVHIQTLAVPH